MPVPLIERSEKETEQKIKKKIEANKAVKGYHNLEVHTTGKRVYVEVHILLDNSLSFEETHAISTSIENELKSVVPNGRITIHTEPVGASHENVWELVKEVADSTPGSRGVHNIHIQDIDGKIGVDLHLEVSANMTLKQAHDVSDQIEKKIQEANPNIAEITVHIETATERVLKEQTGVQTELESYIQHVAANFSEIKSISDIKVRRVGDLLHLVFCCSFDPNIEIRKAHEISGKLEKEIKKTYPNITRIDIHEEPEFC